MTGGRVRAPPRGKTDLDLCRWCISDTVITLFSSISVVYMQSSLCVHRYHIFPSVDIYIHIILLTTA